MPSVDIPTLINWLVSGFVGLIFGVGSAWVAYRYQRRRDDIAWEREKAKLQEQFEHDKRMLELQFRQRLSEFEQQHIRGELLRGVDNPDKAIEDLQRARERIYYPTPMPSMPSDQMAPMRRRASLIPIVIVAIVILSLIICLVPILLRILQR